MVVTGASVACGFHLSGGVGYGLVVIPALLTALITGLGNLINDYYDTDTDRINRPGRPIPSGRLTRTYVYRLYWSGTVVVTVIMVGVLPPGLWQLMLGWEVLLFLYACGGKRVPVLGNLVVGAIVSSTFLAGAMLNQRILAVGFPVAFAFLLVLGRELIKGAEDVRGDRHRDVLDPITERGHSKFDQIQPIVEILSESTFFDISLQIAIRSGTDLYVDEHRMRRSDRGDFAFL